MRNFIGITKSRIFNFLSDLFLKPYLNLLKNYEFFEDLNIRIQRIFAWLFKKKNQQYFYLLGEDKVNWIMDRTRKFAEYFLRLNKIKISNKIFKISHVFCVSIYYLFRNDYRWLRTLKKIMNFKISAIITYDIRNYIERINEYRDVIDIWLSPSKSVYNFLQSKDLKAILLPFYETERNFFFINKTKKKLCSYLKINYNDIKDKIIIGSFQRDSLKNPLLKPKWQKNPDLLIKILRNLPEDKYILLLSSPRRHYLVSKCEKYKIPYIYYGNIGYIKENRDDILVNNQPLKIINLLYNLSDIYIVSSKIEGGPMAILEASFTKTLIFSTDVGFARDFLHKDLIYSENNFDKILQFINNFTEKQGTINKLNEYNYHQVKKVINKNNFKEIYRKIINSFEIKS